MWDLSSQTKDQTLTLWSQSALFGYKLWLITKKRKIEKKRKKKNTFGGKLCI